MPRSEDGFNTDTILQQITAFINQSSGLSGNSDPQGRVEILQKADGKRLQVSASEISDIISRSDNEGRDFLQVNFHSGIKILITDDLIGFKPTERHGLDMERLPKVVTTPDLMSVFEAIQEALHAEDTRPGEIELLRKVFESVIAGGEAVGFDLTEERHWFTRLPTSTRQASA